MIGDAPPARTGTPSPDPGEPPDPVALAHCLGFALAGACPAEPSRWGEALRRWLDQDKHGSMAYLAEHLDVRLDPARLLDNARSVVMVADQYATRLDPPDPPWPTRGRIARYARGRDYHKVIKKRLHTLCDALRTHHPDATFRAFTDTAPVLERELAQRCGLGWIAKHTLLIHPRLGSYLLLGGIVTSLGLHPRSSPGRPSAETVADHCGTCTRCIDACPTSCITPYSVDASRCISYLTIERRLPIDPTFHSAIGNRIFGCDVCQEVCPHNAPVPAARDAGDRIHPDYAPRRDSLDLLEVLSWTEDDRRRTIAGTAMTRATLAMFRRNALIASGNVFHVEHAPELRARVEQIARDPDEDPMVRCTARDVLDRAPPKAEPDP